MKILWLIVVLACVVWYSTVTVYVAMRGAGDIREMLRRLKATGTAGTDEDTTS